MKKGDKGNKKKDDKNIPVKIDDPLSDFEEDFADMSSMNMGFAPNDLNDLQKGMNNMLLFMKILPWLPAFFVLLPVILLSLSVIILLSGELGMFVYLLEAIIIGVVVALIVRYTMGKKIEKSMAGGMLPP
jgi:hypothetical protein